MLFRSIPRKGVQGSQPKANKPQARISKHEGTRAQAAKGKATQAGRGQFSQAEKAKGIWSQKSQYFKTRNTVPNKGNNQYTHANPPRILKRVVHISADSNSSKSNVSTSTSKAQPTKKRTHLKSNSRKVVRQEWRPTGVIITLNLGPN